MWSYTWFIISVYQKKQKTKTQHCHVFCLLVWLKLEVKVSSPNVISMHVIGQKIHMLGKKGIPVFIQR